MQNTISQIETAMAAFQTDLAKTKEQAHGWKAAAKRARATSKDLGKLLLQFRKDSVAAAGKE
ncbi:hypothetical protein LJC46_08280 [Desulfovibrio sp. OttesenSCG-928-G15]|nr:hypothetical protein [Desulfovibrio sp. OttesenSCG-928-G15]